MMDSVYTTTNITEAITMSSIKSLRDDTSVKVSSLRDFLIVVPIVSVVHVVHVVHVVRKLKHTVNKVSSLRDLPEDEHDTRQVVHVVHVVRKLKHTVNKVSSLRDLPDDKNLSSKSLRDFFTSPVIFNFQFSIFNLFKSLRDLQEDEHDTRLMDCFAALANASSTESMTDAVTFADNQTSFLPNFDNKTTSVAGECTYNRPHYLIKTHDKYGNNELMRLSGMCYLRATEVVLSGKLGKDEVFSDADKSATAVPKGHNFHNRRSATCGIEGRSATCGIENSSATCGIENSSATCGITDADKSATAVPKGHNFHNRRSLTCYIEGRSATCGLAKNNNKKNIKVS
jgi:hypothetical protein